MKQVKEKTKNIVNQLSLDLLFKISNTDKKSENHNEKQNSYFLILRRIEKLLVKLDISINEQFPTEDDLTEILKKIELLRDKCDEIIKNLQSPKKATQISIFEERP